jgi:hypothetical protein
MRPDYETSYLMLLSKIVAVSFENQRTFKQSVGRCTVFLC